MSRETTHRGVREAFRHPPRCPHPGLRAVRLPAGMLAWIAEGWVNWSDHGGDVETVLSKNDLCTHATIYRVTNTIGPRSALRQQPPLPLDPSHDCQPPIEAPPGSPSSATRTYPASAPTSASSTSSAAAPGPAQQPTPRRILGVDLEWLQTDLACLRCVGRRSRRLQTAPDGSRRIDWRIIGMIQAHPTHDRTPR